MGWMDTRSRGVDSGQQAGPAGRPHYVTKLFPGGALTQGMYDRTLNDKFGEGYRLAHMYEVAGQVVMVFEDNA